MGGLIFTFLLLFATLSLSAIPEHIQNISWLLLTLVNVLRPRDRGCIWLIHHHPQATFYPTGAKEVAMSVCLSVCVSVSFCILHSILMLSSRCLTAFSQLCLSALSCLSQVFLSSHSDLSQLYLSLYTVSCNPLHYSQSLISKARSDNGQVARWMTGEG